MTLSYHQFVIGSKVPVTSRLGALWVNTAGIRPTLMQCVAVGPPAVFVSLSDNITDKDLDTHIKVETSVNEDVIRFTTVGVERASINAVGDVAVKGNLLLNDRLSLKHILAPVAVPGYGAVYVKDDKRIYYRNDDGVEFLLPLGSGTANYVIKSTPTSIGNSLIYDDGEKVGLKTNTPQATLDINGRIRISTDNLPTYAGCIEWDGSRYRGYTDVGWKYLDVQALEWKVLTEGAMVSANYGYISDSLQRIDFYMPAISEVGDVIRIMGKGAGGWKVVLGDAQVIYFGDMQTTVGQNGFLASTHSKDALLLVCTVKDVEWQVFSSLGTIEVV